MSGTYAIETTGLSKAYGRVLAVDSVSLQVVPGEIYGFVGLNGAGKTTTIRALLGMIRPTAGSVGMLGHTVTPGARGPWHRVGHLVEKPAAYPELTVRENLEIARRLHAVSSAHAVSRVVERMGLTSEADRRAGVLSTGNLQRLALARALLHEPELLILDEPANGLDPAGVVEIRQLLVALARDQGVTVFMSSHILPEVGRLATRVGIIHKGRLLEEFDARRLEEVQALRLEVETRDLRAAAAVLTDAGYAVSWQSGEGKIVLREPRAVNAPDEVATLLVNKGTAPMRLAIVHEDLEGHFLRLTGGSQ
ncbi:MAG TPA: bacitracin ABC transporter ATP-binding protein [Clostridiales bacterium]|nr:bacitracin ABC transporter ATP-binding protein [Clostridiales bacterium]